MEVSPTSFTAFTVKLNSHHCHYKCENDEEEAVWNRKLRETHFVNLMVYRLLNDARDKRGSLLCLTRKFNAV